MTLERSDIILKDVLAFYKLLGHKHETEIRLIDPFKQKPTLSKFVKSEEEFMKVVLEYNGKYQVFAGINERKSNCKTDEDVITLNSILIDLDAKKEGDIATDEQLAKASELADKIIEHFVNHGFNKPVKALSGNGYHLLCTLEPTELNEYNRNDIENHVKQFLKNLKKQFDNDYVKIDESVYNLSRITKVIGTKSIKGIETIERPHRITKFISIPERKEDVRLFNFFMGLAITNDYGSKHHKLDDIIKNGVPIGKRNDSIFLIACNKIKLNRDMGFEPILSMVETWANEKGYTPRPNEIRNVVESAFRTIENEERALANIPPVPIAEIVNQNSITVQEVKKASQEEKQKEDSDKKKCFDFIKPLFKKIVKSEENTNDVFALVTNGDNLELLDLQSTRAQHWINYAFKEIDNEVYSKNFYENVLNDFVAEAQMNGTTIENVYLRIAQLDNTIYYNLSNKENELVRITKDSIELVKFNQDLPLFKRGQITFSQTRPNLEADKTDFAKFIKLFNLKDEDEEILFSVNLISLFLQRCAVPIPFWDGTAGSFKSTNTSLIKLLIDPSGKALLSNRQAMPSDEKDLVLALDDQYLIALDNLSYIEQEQSDILCKAITGGVVTSRKLYTDSDLIIRKLMRKVTANGVSPNLDYPDLNDRIIEYARQTLDDVKYISDSELEIIVHGLLSNTLGYCFQILSKALGLYDIIKKEIESPKTRLADFEIWGEAISQSLGNKKGKFLELFYKKREQSAENERDNNPIVDIVLELMGDKTSFTWGVTQLFGEITRQASEKGFDLKDKFSKIPRNPANLTKTLVKKDGIIFKKLGYKIENSRQTEQDPTIKKGQSVIKVSKIVLKQTTMKDHS